MEKNKLQTILAKRPGDEAEAVAYAVAEEEVKPETVTHPEVKAGAQLDLKPEADAEAQPDGGGEERKSEATETKASYQRGFWFPLFTTSIRAKPKSIDGSGKNHMNGNKKQKTIKKVSQGGVITDWKTAEYLFSEDATCPDTHRIHVSDEYVTDRATVFHSAYLSTCKLRQSTKSVPLGHYLLPPVSVQKEVKAKFGRFIWESDEILGVGTSHGNTSTEQILNVQPDAKGSQSKKGKKRQENCLDTSSLTDEAVCCEVQLYPVNNMVSGYVHIDQLSKFSGELQDFLPSHSGYSVSRSHRRRFPYHYKEGH